MKTTNFNYEAIGCEINLCRDTMPRKDLCNMLNVKGWTTVRGLKWTPTRINSFIKNDKTGFVRKAQPTIDATKWMAPDIETRVSRLEKVITTLQQALR
jgi:hypothetical protein